MHEACGSKQKKVCVCVSARKCVCREEQCGWVLVVMFSCRLTAEVLSTRYRFPLFPQTEMNLPPPGPSDPPEPGAHWRGRLCSPHSIMWAITTALHIYMRILMTLNKENINESITKAEWQKLWMIFCERWKSSSGFSLKPLRKKWGEMSC